MDSASTSEFPRRRVLEAAADEIASRGIDRFTVEGVAARADYCPDMDIAERAAETRAREAAEDAARQRDWDVTRQVLDELAPEIVEQCKKRKLPKTRLAGLLPHKAWTFSVCTPQRTGEIATCMHLAFHPDSTWTLLGCHDGTCVTPVDEEAPFHPGLRQGFVYDKHQHEADVVYTFSRNQLRELLFRELEQGPQC